LVKLNVADAGAGSNEAVVVMRWCWWQ